jgi:hypothetical protein
LAVSGLEDYQAVSMQISESVNACFFGNGFFGNDVAFVSVGMGKVAGDIAYTAVAVTETQKLCRKRAKL